MTADILTYGVAYPTASRTHFDFCQPAGTTG